MKGILSIIFLCGFLVSNAWADWFCPNGFNSINPGDSVDSVISACGKPDAQKTYKKTPFQAQEWNYYIASYPGMTGTLKTTIAFDDSGKVINITVNGAGLPNTQICNNVTIQIGDDTDAITKACGKPAYVNPTANAAPKDIQMTELTYNASPTVTLVFQDGKLIDRK